MKIKGQKYFNMEDEKFWEEVGEYLRYGIPGHDKRGHSAEVRFRVRPFQIDIIGEIKERLPEGWFKNRTALVRNLLAVGCKATLEYFKRYGNNAQTIEIEKIDQMLKGMCSIAKYDRLDEFKADIDLLRQNITRGNRSDKHGLIQFLDRLREEVTAEQRAI